MHSALSAKHQPSSVSDQFLLVSAEMLAALQREQFHHDQRNHADVAYLARVDRLKHYGHHFSKYVGRLARGTQEAKPVERTLVDVALICLSAANTLNQRLDQADFRITRKRKGDAVLELASAVGNFSDACEKIDHLEPFLEMAVLSNKDIMAWTISLSYQKGLDLAKVVRQRRNELAQRYFNFG